MSLTAQLSEHFGDAFAKLGLDRSYGKVVVSQRQELAQFQCNGALPAAKPAGRNPRDLADDVIAALADTSPYSELSVAGPGFINISLTEEYLGAFVDGLTTDPRLGVAMAEPQKVIVDYGGPNVAKELHVGHLRPAIIGEAIKRLFRFQGHDVVGDVHLGDWGAPMGQLIVELEARQPDLPYFDPSLSGPYPDESPVTMDDLQELYPIASAKAKDEAAFRERTKEATFELQDGRAGYRALWQHFRDTSIDAMRVVYGDLGVEFDLWDGESTVHDRIAPLIDFVVSAGVAQESDGALIIDVAAEDESKELPPLLLTRSDGGYLYSTTDLATISARVEDMGAEVLVYVVDLRQSLHFQQLFRAARLAGIAGPDVVLEHDGNGTVNGPDGRPLKTRDGDLPLLRDLITMVTDRAAQRLDENDLASGYPEEERREIARKVGLAALKFGDLSNHRNSDYIFDLERFTSFEGKTGPYLLYGAVRIKSILRKAADLELMPGSILPPIKDAERSLMLGLTRLPEVIERAAELRAPNHLAEYAYDIVTDFNRFYEACHILREEDRERQASWLRLVDLALRLLLLLLDLLGIEVPDRM